MSHQQTLAIATSWCPGCITSNLAKYVNSLYSELWTAIVQQREEGNQILNNDIDWLSASHPDIRADTVRVSPSTITICCDAAGWWWPWVRSSHRTTTTFQPPGSLKCIRCNFLLSAKFDFVLRSSAENHKWPGWLGGNCNLEWIMEVILAKVLLPQNIKPD